MSRKSKEGEECKEVRRRCEQNAVRKLILRRSDVAQAEQVQRLAKLHSLLRSCCCRLCSRHACYVNITATRPLHCVTAGNFLTSAINIEITKADLVPCSQLIRATLGNQRRISLLGTPASYLGGPQGSVIVHSIVHPHVHLPVYRV